MTEKDESVKSNSEYTEEQEVRMKTHQQLKMLKILLLIVIIHLTTVRTKKVLKKLQLILKMKKFSNYN